MLAYCSDRETDEMTQSRSAVCRGDGVPEGRARRWMLCSRASRARARILPAARSRSRAAASRDRHYSPDWIGSSPARSDLQRGARHAAVTVKAASMNAVTASRAAATHATQII